MIKAFKSIKHLGIFSDYSQPQNLEEFKQYNLIYGWNGSGKSTLSRLFRSIETQLPDNSFPNAEYSLLTEDGQITHLANNLSADIKVFNSSFVQENTDLEKGVTESILYIGEEKVHLKKQIKELKDEHDVRTEEYKNVSNSLNLLTAQRDKFFIDAGSELRRFHSKTIFSQYRYDKRDSEELWNQISEGQSLLDFILHDRELDAQLNFIEKGKDRKKIIPIDVTVDAKKISELHQEYKTLLWHNPVIKTIDRLKNNPDLQEWIQQGLNLHGVHSSLKCEYCNQVIPAERIDALRDHFNQDFKDLQIKLGALIEEVQKQVVKLPAIAPTDLFKQYETYFQDQYNSAIIQCDLINKELKNWWKNLVAKLNNPLELKFTVTSIVGGETLNHFIEMLNSIIAQHNNDVDQFQNLSDKKKKSLDLHVVAAKAKQDSLIDLMQEISGQKDKVDKIKLSITDIAKAISDKESELANDFTKIELINEDLSKLLGTGEIQLKRGEKGGYQIMRQSKLATNLSEGEKTAISLVYFMNKLDEKSFEVQNTIIVLDDPMSSFDSNKLFASYSYIMNKCRGAKQLFILTHNFWFFKLIRDWYKNRLPNKYSLYSMNKGVLANAEPALKNHHSEYHFAFSNVLKWSNSSIVDWNDNFLIANQCRRLLESFNAFKTPSKEGFNDILQRATSKGFRADTKDKIMFFLNKYSHLDRIETFESAIENIEGEGKQIAQDTLALIKLMDVEHYDSMCRLCES
jgi:wobble nucleotide-excising tRNase